MTIDTRASVTFTRPDITEGLPKRELSQPYILQIALMKSLPILKEVLVELTLWQCLLRTWVSFMIVMHPWIWDAMCYDWAGKKCCYEAPGHDHIHPPIPRVT
jgi:hypothetical protein